MRDLKTVAEVARLYRVSEGTVRSWIRDGKLPAVSTPGGHYRVPAAALEDPAA